MFGGRRTLQGMADCCTRSLCCVHLKAGSFPMIAIPTRHKSLTLFTGVIVAQVLLLAVQIKRERQVRLIRVWAVELISPVQRVVSGTIYGIEHGWGGYIGLRRAQ